MKFFAYIFCFYLFALTTLPSVRAIKMQFSEKCQSSCQKNNSNKTNIKIVCAILLYFCISKHTL